MISYHKPKHKLETWVMRNKSLFVFVRKKHECIMQFYKKYNTKLTLPKFSESVIVQPAVTLLDKYAYYNF